MKVSFRNSDGEYSGPVLQFALHFGHGPTQLSLGGGHNASARREAWERKGTDTVSFRSLIS